MAGLEGLLTGHTLVKRYEIEDVIGRGGFAVVYRATDLRLSRPVAVKVITLTAVDAATREQLRERLHQEAQAAASLPHHPNLVTVHDVGTDPELGLDFLVMELLVGQNLSQYLATQGPPPTEQAIRILRDTAEGLAVGHREGLIHRDVKPGNIFLAEAHGGEPRVCLVDYGIAQVIEDDQTVTRGMGSTPLSPAFASPEQLRGDRNLTAASDVFSLGVVGYQLLTGERPFVAEAGQVPTSWKVRRPIRELNAEVPAAVDEVLMRAMSENASDRYPDADSFADALDAAVREDDETAIAPAAMAGAAMGVAAMDDVDDGTVVAPAAPPPAPEPPPTGSPVRPVAAAVATGPGDRDPLPPPSTAAAKPKRSNTWLIVLIAALVLGAGGMWAMMSGGGGGGPEKDTAGTALKEGEPVEGSGDTGEGVTGTIIEPSTPVSSGNPDEGSAPSPGTEPAAPVTSGSTPSNPGTSLPPTTSQPAPQQPRAPGVRVPVAQPQPQQPRQPTRRPVVRQPARPPAQQPQRPPQTQPQPQQPQPQQPQPQQPQPQQPPQQPPQPQPQQPTPQQPTPQPQPQQPVPPPPAPRDTIIIRDPPSAEAAPVR